LPSFPILDLKVIINGIEFKVNFFNSPVARSDQEGFDIISVESHFLFFNAFVEL